MPAHAELHQLEAVQSDLQSLKDRFPEAYEEFRNLIDKHRIVGYKSICRIIDGQTPKKLKGLE